MKKSIHVQRGIVYILLFSMFGLFFIQCNKSEEPEDCITRTKRDQYFGYEVWAGDSALFNTLPTYPYYDPMDFYDIDKFYTLIGSSATTQTFSTGDYKYYVVTAPWYCCIDAIEFADGTYLDCGMIVEGNGVTIIGGLAEHPAGGPPAGCSARFLGEPDGISGNLGYKDLCKEPASFGGYITDDAKITARGGGLTVYIADTDCN